MLKKILWITLVIFSTIIVFFVVRPIPFSQWSGLLLGAYPTGNEDKTLAEQLGYSRDDIILIVHADDLAIHKDQTDGALDVMKEGMVKTASVMVPCPDFEKMASIWKDAPDLDLGLHLTLTTGHKAGYRWKPLLPINKVPSLYNPDRYMWGGLQEFGENVNIREALMEIEAQIKRAFAIKEAKMSERDPRKMASQIAGVRASETHLPEDERVFYDPYAEYFLNDEMREGLNDLDKVRTAISQYEQMMLGVNGAIVARVRFIDEYLLGCIAAGLKQLVIIGAGFDTRAYRLEDAKENLKVFEVDHPVTHKVKVEKIKEIFGSLPDHVIYVPVIFGADRFDQKLLENGYNPRLKTLFIVEGLLMYIPPPAVDGLLSFVVKASGPGSSFVADYFTESVVEGTCPLKESQVLRQFVCVAFRKCPRSAVLPKQQVHAGRSSSRQHND